jgi:hydrogenase maturation protein HypF
LLRLPFPKSIFSVVALGSDLKQCAVVTKGNSVHISEAVSDMSDADCYADAERHVRGLMGKLGVHPNVVVCDLHPDAMVSHLAAEVAEAFGCHVMRVQHHHAHIASAVAECDLDVPVIGLALDGFGYGSDGTAWGGECLRVSAEGFQRIGRLKPLSLVGGDQAAKQPWRMAVAALSWLPALQLEEIAGQLFGSDLPVTQVMQLCRTIETQQCSSAGRYFDAASALITGITVNSFEAEAAIRLEQLAQSSGDEACFSYRVEETGGLLELNLGEAFVELVDLKLKGKTAAMLAKRFHNTMICGLADLVVRAANQQAISDIALSGGCFLNQLLMKGLKQRLAGLRIWHNERLSPGDGNISVGQAWIALQHLKRSY